MKPGILNRRIRDAVRILCASTALAVAAAMPASAEPVLLAQAGSVSGPDALPPHEIVTMLLSTGLRPLDRPVRRGPTYVLRALERGGREMRVVVDARRGEILSVAPVVTASRLPSSGPLTMGPYERMDPSYLGPESLPPPGLYAPERPSAVYGDEPPILYGARPPASLPSRMGEPEVIMSDPRSTGALPPPPDRFQQRAAPAKPAQAKNPPPSRAAAAAPPKAAPLPKPRPIEPAAAAPAPEAQAKPADAAKPPTENAAPPAATETPPPQAFD